jgi:hypothetical protein
MNLVLERTDFTDKSTIGELYHDDEFLCFILEDVVREEKIKNETAIPYGKYEVVVTYSPRFRRNLPLLLDVPNYSGVRIHPGNKASDTEGCLLPGTRKGTDFVFESKKAFDSLYKRIDKALKAGEEVVITIEILVNHIETPYSAF